MLLSQKRNTYHQVCLTGGWRAKFALALKFILGAGALSMILVILPYSSGVSFSRSSRLRRYSISWSTFLGPITMESRYWYLMVQARTRCMRLYPNPSAISFSFLKPYLFLGVSMGSQKNSLYLVSWGKLYLAVSYAPSRYFPVRQPPARGLQAIRPYLCSFRSVRQSNQASSLFSMLQQFWPPMGRCRFNFSQIASASVTHSADQLEVAQQKLIPAQMTSWKPRQTSQRGVQSSNRWAQTTSTQSNCNRERHCCSPSLMCLRLMDRRELISGWGEERILVEMTTSSLGTPMDFKMVPSCVSALPAEQISAVSKWLMPWARQLRISSSSLASPSLVKLRSCPMVMTETCRPEWPKQRYSILFGFKVDMVIYDLSYLKGMHLSVTSMGCHCLLLLFMWMGCRALSFLYISSSSQKSSDWALVSGSIQLLVYCWALRSNRPKPTYNCSSSRKCREGSCPFSYPHWISLMNFRRSFPTLPTYQLRQGKKRWKYLLNWPMGGEKACREKVMRLYMQQAPSSHPTPASRGEQSSPVLVSCIAANLSRYCLQGVSSCLPMYSQKFPRGVTDGNLLRVYAMRSIVVAELLSWSRLCWKPSHFNAIQTDLAAAAVISLWILAASLRRSGLSS